IATGIKCALPFGKSWISPSARGPFEAAGLRPYCAIVPCAATWIPMSRVTASSEVRYNQVRRGEDPMEVNDKAPDFSTTDENGKEVALKDFRGKTVVLFFYPKADTPG